MPGSKGAKGDPGLPGRQGARGMKGKLQRGHLMCSNGAKRDPPGFLGHQYARSIKSRWQGYIYIYYKVTGKGGVEYVRDPEFSSKVNILHVPKAQRDTLPGQQVA